MPSDKNPSNIKVGAGQAGAGSVSISAITFTSSGSNVKASEVSNETPLALSGSTVQDHINQVSLSVTQPLPNLLGSSSNALNPSEVDTDLGYPTGFYYDGGAVAVALYNATSLNFVGSFFPADRGVLALEVDGVATHAIDLDTLFVEGSPDVVSTPSRLEGQDTYLQGTNPTATVESLPQGFNLTFRLPVLDAYDPGVPYEAYAQTNVAHQLASFNIDVNQAAGTTATYVVKHYKSRRDFSLRSLGAVFGQSDVPTDLGLDIYVDGTADAPIINSFSSAPSANTSAGAKTLSGVSVYDKSVDDLPVSLNVSQMFSDSFLQEGIKINMQPGKTEGQASLVYTDYDGGNPVPAQVAAFSGEPDYTMPSIELQPQLVASNPFNDVATQTTATANVVLGHGIAFETRGAVNATRLVTETFSDEAVRYDFPATSVMEPDGTGSTFDSTSTLVANDAQVRPAKLNCLLALVEGGELGYPSTDYSSGFLPTGNPDYSAYSGPAYYFRSFDMGSPVAEGMLRITGLPSNASIVEDLLWQGDLNNSANNYGHPHGLRMLLGTDPLKAPSWDLFKPFELGGSLVSYEMESANIVKVRFMLHAPPQKSPEGYYPLRFAVHWMDDTSASTAFYKIQYLSLP